MIKIRLNDLPIETGIIKKILVQEGEVVKTWQNILIVSCGNSDIAISTLFDGIIEAIYIVEGDIVQKGDVAFKIRINTEITSEMAPIKKNLNEAIDPLQPTPQNGYQHDQQLRQDFTAEFRNETLKTEPKPTLNEPLAAVNENVKEVINDLQEKNAAGTSKFRERILKKLHQNQDESSAVRDKTETDAKNKSEKPLSFREIIMNRINNLQKDGNETETNAEQVVKKSEPKSVLDNIATKMSLIKSGKINNTSNLEEINEIISQETIKDINSKYEPTGYYDKAKLEAINPKDKVPNDDDASLEELVNEGTDGLTINKKKSNDDFNLQKSNLNNNTNNNYEKPHSSDYFNYHPLNNVNNWNDPQIENKSSLMFSYNEILSKSKIPPAQISFQNLTTQSVINIGSDQNELELLSHLETRHQLSSLRNNAVNALVISNRQIPHLNLNCEVDMNNIISLCEKLTSRSNNKLRLNIMVFLVKAISLALEEYPKLNASYEPSTNELVIKRYHHVAIARQNISGLQTAVMKFVDKLSIEQLAVEMERSDQRIRAKKPLANEFVGSTITIINFGITGAINGSLPIFSPNIAVLGIGKIVKKPIVVGKNLAIRHVANISLSVDQRAIDIYDAGQFLDILKNILEEPYILSLN